MPYFFAPRFNARGHAGNGNKIGSTANDAKYCVALERCVQTIRSSRSRPSLSVNRGVVRFGRIIFEVLAGGDDIAAPICRGLGRSASGPPITAIALSQSPLEQTPKDNLQAMKPQLPGPSHLQELPSDTETPQPPHAASQTVRNCPTFSARYSGSRLRVYVSLGLNVPRCILLGNLAGPQSPPQGKWTMAVTCPCSLVPSARIAKATQLAEMPDTAWVESAAVRKDSRSQTGSRRPCIANGSSPSSLTWRGSWWSAWPT